MRTYWNKRADFYFKTHGDAWCVTHWFSGDNTRTIVKISKDVKKCELLKKHLPQYGEPKVMRLGDVLRGAK